MTTSAISDKSALITGSATGIGLAIALALARDGVRVVLHGLPGQRAATTALANSMGALGSLHVDLQTESGVQELVEQCDELLPDGIDILVLNAAIERRAPWDQLSRGDAELQLAVNLLAPLGLTQKLTSGMRSRGWGRVLFVGSVQQVRPHPQLIAYAAAKAALENMARNLAVQLGASGVTVNTLSPGAIETDMNRAVLNDPEYRAAVLSRIPAGRVGTPADCAAAASFLCSDGAAYINGANLFIDGGMAVR
ncbi:MAG TPA: SDR family oxidoreductase [Polaromonas sp.]|uniref:SDR family NAD(P)-dependent oxidoreductase n=1 Tax=Polaromonas sp. TaxID=1869339 RepID=UPI002D57697D|nr:SDR family oxidoreductase [Polaromonas sp.]HYW58133.1 SDR family oxidoreductase [Polaromonas sp.]